MATATTSLWKAPAAIASSDCRTNRVRAGSSRCSRATAREASTCWRAGKGPPRHAVDEDLDARRVVARAQPHMIGRALVAEGRGDGRVHREMRVVGEGEAELRQRRRPFVAAVRHRPQVGDGEVAAAVRRVRRGRDGRGIGRPHRRGRERGGAQLAARLRRRRAELGQPGPVRARMRQQHALRQPEPQIVPHLLDALQRRGARIGDLALVRRRREVAEAEPGIIVARPDDAVEIDLDERHRSAPDREEAVAGLDAEQGGAGGIERRHAVVAGGDSAVAGGEVRAVRPPPASSGGRPLRRWSRSA